MSLKHVSREWKQRPFRTYYQWLKKGRLSPVLKFIWTGVWMTGLLTFNWEIAMFVIFFGFIFREIYCNIVVPDYRGHPLLR